MAEKTSQALECDDRRYLSLNWEPAARLITISRRLPSCCAATRRGFLGSYALRCSFDNAKLTCRTGDELTRPNSQVGDDWDRLFRYSRRGPRCKQRPPLPTATLA